MFTAGMFTVGMFTVGLVLFVLKGPPPPIPPPPTHFSAVATVRRVSTLWCHILALICWMYSCHNFLDLATFWDPFSHSFP